MATKFIVPDDMPATKNKTSLFSSQEAPASEITETPVPAAADQTPPVHEQASSTVPKAIQTEETTPTSVATKTTVPVDMPTQNNNTLVLSQAAPAPKIEESTPALPRCTCSSASPLTAMQDPPAGVRKPNTGRARNNGKKNTLKTKPPVPTDTAEMTLQQLQQFYDSGGQLPSADIHPTYKPGRKLINDDGRNFAELGTAISSLEKHYIDNFERAVGLYVRFFPENFFDASELLFNVGWEDLYDMLNFKAMDTA